MKILYVGHTYTVRANQAKIAALARAMPDSEITLVTPHAWRGPLYENRAERFEVRNMPKQEQDSTPPLSFPRTRESRPHASDTPDLDSRFRGNDSSIGGIAGSTPDVCNVDHKILKAYLIGKEGAYFFGPSIVPLIAKLRPDIVHVEQGAYAVVYTQILTLLKLLSPQSKAIFFTWWNLPYRPKGLKRLNESFNLRHSAAAIAGNEAAKAILIEHGFRNPIHVIPQLGIDLPSLAGHPHRDTDSFVIGYAGRIAEEKGVLDLVEAVGKMEAKSRCLLYFVGAGDALSEVERRAIANNIPFEHHPAVMNEALPEHLAKMDVLVLPSRTTPKWVEQFGHILLEAMALGIPVIGSSSGEIPNVIGDAGFIFPEGDTATLTDRLDRLAQEPETRAALSRAGRARVEAHFTHDIIAQEQADIYRWMLREGESVGRKAASR